MIDDAARDALAKLLGPWVPDDDHYHTVNDVLERLHDAGWELVPRARIDQYLELSEAILAVAGAELEGEGKERAWTKLEEALQVAFGTWQVMALERITALRAFPEGPHRLS
jgi:hypothetical protein